MFLLVVSVSVVKGTTDLRVFQFDNTTKELNLGGDYDYVTRE